MSADNFTLTVAGVSIAAKRWRNGSRRVIALHGWLDNAASFDALAPSLKADVVALDLAGHGHSYHRTPQSSYNIWEDLPDILRVADELQWPTFDVIGHSRGAIIATLLAATMSERVSSTILLDGLRSDAVPESSFCDQLARHLREHLAPRNEGSIYSSIDHAVRVRCRATGMSETAAQPIVERALIESEQGWRWRNDPRVRLASAVKMSQTHIDATLTRFAHQPHLILLADQGVGAMLKRTGELERWQELRMQTLAGSHHFHLEEQAPAIAETINVFWGE